jgi:hypothetical protein
MSGVFGTPRRPAYVVTRTDADGQPISLDKWQEIDSARQSLVARGLLREGANR